VNRRLGRGLQFRGVYTFSKSLDDGDNMNTSVATNSPAFIANPLQPKADYAGLRSTCNRPELSTPRTTCHLGAAIQQLNIREWSA
jgi:hypothetical protein